MDILLAASVLNYLALASIFIHAYFHPKEWNGWLVSAYVTYVMIYILTGFIFVLVVLLGAIPCTWPLLLLYLVVLVWSVRISFDAAGSRTIIPFALYIASMAWLAYAMFGTGNPAGALIYLAVMYFGGMALFLFPIGMLISIPLGLIAPEPNKEHIRMLKEKYGEGLLHGITLEAKGGGSVGLPYMPPSFMVGVAIAYCIWMLITILLASRFGLYIAL